MNILYKAMQFGSSDVVKTSSNARDEAFEKKKKAFEKEKQVYFLQ